MLPVSASSTALRSVLGGSESVDQAAGALREFDRLGVAPTAAGAWIRSLIQAESRLPRTDLVWSGPEVKGLHARDTRRVYEEVIGATRHSLWVSTYAFFEGPNEAALKSLLQIG